VNSKRKKYKVVWACDFCGKEFNTKKESDKHELECPQNPINKNRKTEKIITVIFIIFSCFYILTYLMVNSYAKVNGFESKNLFSPSEWFTNYEKEELTKEIPTPYSTPSPTNTPSPTIVQQTYPRLSADKEFEMINNYRMQNGLSPFQKSSQLCEIANKRAEFLKEHFNEAYNADKNIDNGHLGINEFRGMYSGKAMGENIGLNARSDNQNIEGWKSSPAHNANLLAKGWNGVAVDKACISIKEWQKGNIIVILVGDI